MVVKILFYSFKLLHDSEYSRPAWLWTSGVSVGLLPFLIECYLHFSVTACRHSRLPMRHREPWQGFVHAAQCGGLLIVLSTPTTTSEQAAQMTPALFGLASGSMFISILFISSNYPSLASVDSTTDKRAHRITGMFLFIFQVPSNGLLLLLRYRDKHDIANHGGDTTNHQPTTRLASRV